MRAAFDLLGTVPQQDLQAEDRQILPNTSLSLGRHDTAALSTMRATTPVFVGLDAQMQPPAIVSEFKGGDFHAFQA